MEEEKIILFKNNIKEIIENSNNENFNKIKQLIENNFIPKNNVNNNQLKSNNENVNFDINEMNTDISKIKENTKEIIGILNEEFKNLKQLLNNYKNNFLCDLNITSINFTIENKSDNNSFTDTDIKTHKINRSNLIKEKKIIYNNTNTLAPVIKPRIKNKIVKEIVGPDNQVKTEVIIQNKTINNLNKGKEKEIKKEEIINKYKKIKIENKENENDSNQSKESSSNEIFNTSNNNVINNTFDKKLTYDKDKISYITNLSKESINHLNNLFNNFEMKLKNLQNLTNNFNMANYNIKEKFEEFENKINDNLNQKFLLKYCTECEKVDYFYGFLKCNSCLKETCKNCINLCQNCKKLYCKKCLECPKCKNSICEKCRTLCQTCKKKYCENCINDDFCKNCSEQINKFN